MSVPGASQQGTDNTMMDQTTIRDSVSSNGTVDEESGHGSARGRKSFATQLPILQIRKSLSVKWAERSERPEEVAGAADETPKLPTTPYKTVSSESEKIITNKIRELSALESPLLRELAKRLSNIYKIDTPTATRNSSNLGGRNVFSGIVVGSRWQEIQGCNRWAGLLDPIDPILRAEIVRYGEFAQACYDTFDGDVDSKYCGSSRYTKEELLEKVGLDKRGYEITQFLYATAELHLPNFFSKSLADDTWSKDSNWIGFVAVCTSPEEIARLGRRDILVAWRGTLTRFEWIQDLQDYLAPAGFDPRQGNANVMVESGFLNVYKSSNRNSRYNVKSAREQVLEAVKYLVEKYKSEGELSITITGHSLGSALATLCGYDIAESGLNLLSTSSPPVPSYWNSKKSAWTDPAEAAEGSENTMAGSALEGVAKEPQAVLSGPKAEQQAGSPGNRFRANRVPITVYSFAGPRVGNRAFRDRVEELGVTVLRVANRHDKVTKVPGALFTHTMELLQPVIHFLPSYKHVGVKLKVDHTLSHYLEETTDPVHSHNLEAYLHVVDGFHGTGKPFNPTLRDYALVNKSCNFLKHEYYIPAYWWQEANKGLVKDRAGHWVLPQRDAEIFPKTPVQAQERDRQFSEFFRSVSIAAQRSAQNVGGEQGQAVLATAEQGKTVVRNDGDDPSKSS